MTIRKAIKIGNPNKITTSTFKVRCLNCGEGGDVQLYNTLYTYQQGVEISIYKAICNVCNCHFKVEARRE